MSDTTITVGAHVFAVTEFQGPRVSVRLAGEDGKCALLTPNQLRNLADTLDATRKA